MLTWYTTYVQRKWTRSGETHEMIIDIRGQTVLLIQLVHFERQLFVIVYSLNSMPSIIADRVGTCKPLFYVQRIIVTQIARHDHFTVTKFQR